MCRAQQGSKAFNKFTRRTSLSSYQTSRKTLSLLELLWNRFRVLSLTILKDLVKSNHPRFWQWPRTIGLWRSHRPRLLNIREIKWKKSTWAPRTFSKKGPLLKAMLKSKKGEIHIGKMISLQRALIMSKLTFTPTTPRSKGSSRSSATNKRSCQSNLRNTSTRFLKSTGQTKS